MIAYTTFGTDDMPRASGFYDTLLGELGATRLMDMGRIILWGTGPDAPMFAVCTPINEEPATVGNGTMVAIAVDSREKVDAMHSKALELGGTDEGAPGERSSFYIGYFRDLDGNKLNFFYGGS